MFKLYLQLGKSYPTSYIGLKRALYTNIVIVHASKYNTISIRPRIDPVRHYDLNPTHYQVVQKYWRKIKKYYTTHYPSTAYRKIYNSPHLILKA